MSAIQVYGSFTGYGSFANISRAIVRAIQHAKLPVTIYDTSDFSPKYDDVSASIGMNNHAPVGVFVGYPPMAVGWLHGHKYTVLVTVCESNRIPTEWVAICRSMKLTVVPSTFCLGAFQDSGVKDVKIIPHGVDDAILLTKKIKAGKIESRGESKVRLLHVSSALSFPARKGTSPLLLAFRRVVKDRPDLHLYLKIPKVQKFAEAIEQLGLEKQVSFLPDEPIAPSRMGNFLRLFDAVVQPSRGEGFGIVGLEARCAGVPVIITNDTGHSEHFMKDADIPVKTGPWTPMETQGNAMGMAPTVPVEAVEEALEDFLIERPRHKQRTEKWALEHGAEWTWRRVLASLIAEIKPHAMAPRLHKLGEGLRGLK